MMRRTLRRLTTTSPLSYQRPLVDQIKIICVCSLKSSFTVGLLKYVYLHVLTQISHNCYNKKSIEQSKRRRKHQREETSKQLRPGFFNGDRPRDAEAQSRASPPCTAGGFCQHRLCPFARALRRGELDMEGPVFWRDSGFFGLTNTPVC